MGEVMTQAIIGMPYDMAMSDELSRRQFHERAQYLLGEHEKLQAELAKLRAELERTATWIEDLPVPTVGAAGQLVRIDKVLAAAPSAPKADDPVKVQLLEALEALSKSAPPACCVDFHHQPGDYHGADETCPALDRYEGACLAARAAIAAARKGE